MIRSDAAIRPAPRRLAGRILANGTSTACLVHELGATGARLTLPNAAGIPERFVLETSEGTHHARTGLRRQGENGAELWVSFEAQAHVRVA